jgi:hypothetical protein
VLGWRVGDVLVKIQDSRRPKNVFFLKKNTLFVAVPFAVNGKKKM